MNQLRRALLFSPGDSKKKLEKAASLKVDSIIIDLEDAVAPNKKLKARTIVVEALSKLDFGTSERLIRINTNNADTKYQEIWETASAQPDGYVVPKVEGPDQIEHISQVLTKIEAEQNQEIGTYKLMPLIETAKGIVNIHSIAQADDRIDAIIFGAEDLATDIGAYRSRDNLEILYARSVVVLAAAAYGIQAIDTVHTHLNELDHLKIDCDLARQLGFDGKLAIHPNQVDIIQKTFTPSPSEIEHAQLIISSFSENELLDIGVFELNGQMIDMPMVQAAKRTLAKASLARSMN
jgi:citrate lyase beta subunit